MQSGRRWEELVYNYDTSKIMNENARSDEDKVLLTCILLKRLLRKLKQAKMKRVVRKICL